MKLLLDTHIWLWLLMSPARLSSRVLKELSDAQNELWLSPVSLWEVISLCQKGRVKFNQEVSAWILDKLTAAPMVEAPLNHDVALATAHLQMPQRDPTDRFLVATAKVFELTLVTADERLMKVREITILANREKQ